MEARAKRKYLRISPRKMRIVADVVRGKNAQQAITTLEFMPQKAAAMVVSTNNKNYIKACKMLGVSTKMGRWTPPKAPNTPRTPTTLWERVAAGEHLRA